MSLVVDPRWYDAEKQEAEDKKLLEEMLASETEFQKVNTKLLESANRPLTPELFREMHKLAGGMRYGKTEEMRATQYRKFIVGPVQLDYGMIANAQRDVLQDEVKGLCAGIDKYTAHCESEMFKDAWNGITLDSYTEQTVSTRDWCCKHDGNERVPAADYVPLRKSNVQYVGEAFGSRDHQERANKERREASKRKLFSTLREWPRCAFTDTDLSLSYVKGKAHWLCKRCYQ